MTVNFVSSGPFSWGSSRMRAYWVTEYIRNATTTQQPIDADAYVWQKRADIDFIKAYQSRVHYWDVCDPVWWFSPNEARDIALSVDGIVFSSQPLLDDFLTWCEMDAVGTSGNYHVVPDRLELTHFPKQKAHEEAGVIRFVWFGVAVNRQALYAAVANLERLKANGRNIMLTIFDDRPDIQFGGVSFPIYHTRWNLENENEILASHDIALLPPYPGPWGQVKSNNKTLTANACGLPVTHGLDYYSLLHLVDSHQRRQEEASAGYLTVLNHYTTDKSAAEWEAILC